MNRKGLFLRSLVKSNPATSHITSSPGRTGGPINVIFGVVGQLWPKFVETKFGRVWNKKFGVFSVFGLY